MHFHRDIHFIDNSTIHKYIYTMPLIVAIKPEEVYSSWSFTRVSWASKPEFTARVFGIINMASAKACTPRRALPFTFSLNFCSSSWAAISKAPAPGTTALSSIAFFTARRPRWEVGVGAWHYIWTKRQLFVRNFIKFP